MALKFIMASQVYLTAPALEELKNELTDRVKRLRLEISQRIADAKEMGDLSENFAYHEAREQQGINESRVLQIEEMLRDFQIISGNKSTTITLGSKFRVNGPLGAKTYELVGESESDPMAGRISNVSPLGQAFMNKAVKERVVVQSPSGENTYEIIEIL